MGRPADARPGAAALPSTCDRQTERRVETPRYIIERLFPNGWAIPVGARGRERCLAIVERNADEGVTWLHSYVREDGKKAFCVYDAPSPEALTKETLPTRNESAVPTTKEQESCGATSR